MLDSIAHAPKSASEKLENKLWCTEKQTPPPFDTKTIGLHVSDLGHFTARLPVGYNCHSAAARSTTAECTCSPEHQTVYCQNEAFSLMKCIWTYV